MNELARWVLSAGDLPAAMKARRAFERLLRDISAPPSDVAGSELIFGELVANGMEHGTGTVTLALARRGADLVLSVCDEGGWAFSSSVNEAPPPSQLRGRGLFFVRAVARCVKCSDHDRSTHVVLPITVREN